MYAEAALGYISSEIFLSFPAGTPFVCMQRVASELNLTSGTCGIAVSEGQVEFFASDGTSAFVGKQTSGTDEVGWFMLCDFYITNSFSLYTEGSSNRHSTAGTS